MNSNISIRNDLKNSTDLETLHKTIARFQRIFNGSGYGFWEWDLTTQQVDWSGGFWERLGYKPAEEPALSDASQILTFIHPDDVEPTMTMVRHHFRTSEPLDTNYRLRTKSGDYFWTQVRADSLRDESGRVIFVSGVTFDTSALKEAEDALRESEARQERIIQSSSDGIWEWYADQGGFHFSSRCWELIGYNANDDEITLGEDKFVIWRQHIHPQDLAKFDQALNNHLTYKIPFDVEYRLIGKDKDIHWVRGRGRSHELRTPLNAILGYAQLFEYDLNLSQQQMNNVREIRKAGDHLLNLINDVLDLAKIESGKMTVSLEPVLVSRIIEEAQMFVQPQADVKKINLFCTLNDFENTYVTADNVRFKQALINLLGNAVKYNNPGGEVEVSLSLPAEKVLRLNVRDNGYGIPANRQAEVFQPFNRLSAENSKIEGSGVGLVITKQFLFGQVHCEALQPSYEVIGD
ncbi:MAG: PAS domain S-box protein [Moraxellaceae bacterium]|nr:MAG: PAS domain S-box protein [Moraxellaceae bacterium]